MGLCFSGGNDGKDLDGQVLGILIGTRAFNQSFHVA